MSTFQRTQRDYEAAQALVDLRSQPLTPHDLANIMVNMRAKLLAAHSSINLRKADPQPAITRAAETVEVYQDRSIDDEHETEDEEAPPTPPKRLQRLILHPPAPPTPPTPPTPATSQSSPPQGEPSPKNRRKPTRRTRR